MLKKRVLFLVFLLATATAAAQRPHILLSNDDGIEAPGLQAMYRALATFARVTVAAPATNQSATGHGLTVGDTPIFVRSREDKAGNRWYAITARPATCVSLALQNLLDSPPDLVVSGSNRGANLGLVTYYSGTLGAAREAAFHGIAALAVSVEHGQTMDYPAAARFSVRVARVVLKRGLPRGVFLNINLPALPASEIKGVRVVPLSQEAPHNRFTRGETPGGRVYFWPGYRPLSKRRGETDVQTILDGYITITPLVLDATSRDSFDTVRGWQLTK